MATGDTADMQGRLQAQIPNGWGSGPRWSALLGGISDALASIYAQITYAIAQSRIATATGVWLDLIASDFLGNTLVRASGQADTDFRAAIQREILRERVTRAGMSAAIKDLTGYTPAIFEPWNASDTGGMDLGGLGFDAGGAFGATDMTAQCLITVSQAASAGIPNVVGLLADGSAGATGGLDVGAAELADIAQAQPRITTSDIYGVINRTRPVGVTCWVGISAVLQ